MRMGPTMNVEKRTTADIRGQAGGVVLPVILSLGIVLLLVQGTTWYQSKSGTSFLGSEKNKVLAMQMAEAGVEENIADLAKRVVRVTNGMSGFPTYENKSLPGGRYSSTVTAVAVGPGPDTVDVMSMGFVGQVRQTIRARLRLNKYLDSSLAILVHAEPETTVVLDSVIVPDTLETVVLPPDPSATPAITATAAYAACMAGAPPTCRVCHLPMAPSPAGRLVVTQAKAWIASHNSHTGDYVTTDGTCDMYDTSQTQVISFHMKWDTTFVMVDKNVYDTTMVIDTAMKVQVLSWR